jgi:hypothetical protein
VEYLVVALVVVAIFAAYVAWLDERVGRLQARSAAARTALSDQLVRRAEAAARIAGDGPAEPSRAAARAALEAGASDLEARAAAENDLVRALRATPLHPADPMVAELLIASRRVGVARQVYNDAVRDTRALALARVPRAFRLRAGRALPGYFDVDELDLEAVLPPSGRAAPAGRASDHPPAAVAWQRSGDATPGPV